MNSLACACVALVGTVATAAAGPTERAIIAAMKLSEQPNYTWFSMLDESSGSYEIEGKTSAGVTWVRMPMVASIGRHLGRETDTQLEALFNGKQRGVVRVGSDWRFPAEIADQARETTERPRLMVRGSAGGSFGVPGGQPIGAAAPFLEGRRGSRTLAAIQFGVTHPHEELAIIVSSFTNMVETPDGASGTLSETGAALLLVRSEQSELEPLASAGTFKLWVQQGVVIKYQLKLEGVLAIGRWKKMNVQVNATTTLKDIGRTLVNLPDEARVKLALAPSKP